MNSNNLQQGGNFTSKNSFQNARPDGSNNRNRYMNNNNNNNNNKPRAKQQRSNHSTNNMTVNNNRSDDSHKGQRGSSRGNSFRGRGTGRQFQKRNININNNPSNFNKTMNNSNSFAAVSEKKLKNQVSEDIVTFKSTPTFTAETSNNVDTHSNFESRFMGALLPSPDKYGYQKINHHPQKIPKYMLKEHVLFDSLSFTPNEWDRRNQQMLLAREAEFSGDSQTLFEEFQEYRNKEREMMEKLNLVDHENAKKSLSDAIIFRGSCYEMCPVYERVERSFKNQVSKWEKDSKTNKISRYYALKTFMRPSGQAPPLPSDVRPPLILSRTLNYIIDNLLTKLPDTQSFIWDRTRSIRQDFTFQNNYSGVESIDCHEKICRIHILSLHIMAGANDPDYQQQQEVEQFNNSLQTLTHMYDDVRSRGGFCPNEAEFRAYELISKIKDTELDRHLQTLPFYIIEDSLVQQAVMLRGLIIQGIGCLNIYSEFFKAVLNPKSTTFLLASLSEIHFNEIRYNALKSMTRSYHSKSRKFPDANIITNSLGYNNVDQLLETCKLYGLTIQYDESHIPRIDVLGLKSDYKASQKQPFTDRITQMIAGRSMKDIVSSGHPNVDLSLKKPKELEDIARDSFKEGKLCSEIISSVFKKVKNVSIPSIPNKVSHVMPEIQNVPVVNGFVSAPVSSSSGMSANTPVFKTPNIPFNLNPQQETSAYGDGGYSSPQALVCSNNDSSNVDFKFGANKEPLKSMSSTFSFVSNSKSTGAPQSKSVFSFTANGASSSNNTEIPNPTTEDALFFQNKEQNGRASFMGNDNRYDFPNSQLNIASNSSNVASTNNAYINVPTTSGFGLDKTPTSDLKSVLNNEQNGMLKPHMQEPVKKKLTDSPYFEEAANIEIDDMIKEYVSQTASNIIKQAIQAKAEKLKEESRKSVIFHLQNELFEAFMREQIYLATLEAKSNIMYEKNVKLDSILQIKRIARRSLLKKRVKEAKLLEIQKFNNSVIMQPPPLPISQPLTPSKINNSSFIVPSSPINLSKIFTDVKPVYDLNVSLVLRDSKSNISQWVCKQLNFVSFSTPSVNVISENKMTLSISKLPDDFTPKNYFKKIGMLIVQIGTLTNDDPTFLGLHNKLKTDSKVIAKLRKYLEKYSLHKVFSMMIVYVDSFGISLPYDEIKRILRLDDVINAGFIVGFVDLSRLINGLGNGIGYITKIEDEFKNVLSDVLNDIYAQARVMGILDDKDESKVQVSKTIENSGMETTGGNGASLVELIHERKPSSKSSKQRINYIKNLITTNRIKKRKLSLNFPNGNDLINDNSESVLVSNGTISDTMLNSRDYGFQLDVSRSYLIDLNEGNRYEADDLNKIERKRKLDELEELADNVLNS